MSDESERTEDVRTRLSAAAGDGEVVGRVGPYRLLRELGRGGQATVWLAEDSRLGRRVALKVVAGLGPVSSELVARFRREAQVASRLDHPGICTVYEAAVERDVAYIAMRYVKGETLARRCGEASSESRTKDGVRRVLELVEKVARALHVAHEAGVIHRDVKPGNIMVTPEGDPVVLDFGLAGVNDGGDVTLTRTGDVFGTPAYMSPEQVAGTGRGVDLRTDVWSLGVVLYECLAGRRPFLAPTRDGLYRAIAERGVPPMRRLNPAVPRDAELVLETALQKRPDHRYGTAEALADDLRAVIEDRPVSVKPVSPPVRFLRWARRRPAVAALIVVLALGIPTLGVLGGILAARWSDIQLGEAERQHRWVEENLALGFLCLHDGRQDEAQEHFERVLARAPDTPEAVVGLLLGERRLGRAEDALRRLVRFERLLEAHPALRRFQAALLRDLGRDDAAGRIDRELPPARSALDFFVLGNGAIRDAGSDPAALERAFSHFTMAALLSGGSRALYHHSRAYVAGVLGDPDAAEECVRVLEARWPDTDRTHVYCGLALYQHDLDRALVHFRRAAELRPDSVVVWYNLGVALSHGSRPEWIEETVAAFRRAIRIRPDHLSSHYNLGSFLLRLGRAEEALEEFDRALAIEATDPFVHNNRGAALARLGRDIEARAEFERALELAPKNASSLANLGDLDRDQGRPEQAIARYEEAIAADPGYRPAHSKLGRLLDSLGRSREAIAAHRRAAELAPRDATVQNDLGTALARVGRQSEAVDAFRRALHLDPTLAGAYNNLGIALVSLGRTDEAADAYERALELDAATVETRINLALMHSRAGRLEQAAARLRDACEAAPEFEPAWYNLGVTLGRQRDHAGAAAAYRRAIALAPDHAESHCNLGLALREMGRLTEALAELERGHRLGTATRGWSYPSARWVEETRRWCELERQLAAHLEGSYEPPTPGARCDLAAVAVRTGRPALASRLYRIARAQGGVAALDGHHLTAARAAAAAAAGEGDAGGLADERRRELGLEAAARLREGLERWTADWDEGRLRAGRLGRRLRACLAEPSLTALAADLAQLAAVRAEIEELLAEVAPD